MTNDQICIAAQLLLNEAHRLEDGEYSTSTVSRMFVDCIDRTMTRSKVIMTGPYPQFSSAASAASTSEKKTVHTAMVATNAEAAAVQMKICPRWQRLQGRKYLPRQWNSRRLGRMSLQLSPMSILLKIQEFGLSWTKVAIPVRTPGHGVKMLKQNGLRKVSRAI